MAQMGARKKISSSRLDECNGVRRSGIDIAGDTRTMSSLQRLAAVGANPSLPLTEDGQPYDVRYRVRAAMAAVEAARCEQPEGIKRPSGPSGLWFVGGPLLRRCTLADNLIAIRDRYPEIAYFTLRREHVYVLSHPDLIQQVFATQGRDGMKGRGLQVAKAVLGEGLLTSEGEQHLRQRRMIQPAFHRDRIAHYAEQMVEVTRERCEQWRDGEVIETNGLMSDLTLGIVGRALFGSDLSDDAAQVADAVGTVMNNFQRLMFAGGGTLMRLPLPSTRKMIEDANQLDALVQRLIDEHRKQGDTGDLLSMLIAAQEDGHFMSDINVRDEAMTMVLAGHETTAMALTWTWLLLSQNPSIRRQVDAELAEVLAGRTPTFDDYSQLNFTRACVAESMRLYPPAWLLARRATADLQAGEWLIPKGSVVIASQMAMHRDPRFWELPDAYLPSRWLVDGVFDESAPVQRKGAWFPFGFGKRRCIGDQFAWVEATLVLATIAQHWDLQQLNPNPPKLQTVITLRPREPMPARLVRKS